MVRILAIDDDPINRQLLSIYLEDDFEYEIVNNATDGLKKLQDGHFDAVLTDVNLQSEYDGVWLGMEIKRDERLRHIPVVAYTAFVVNSINREMFGEAFDYVIEKPITKNHFIGKLLDIVNENPTA